jgi:hypothetical protein
MQEVAGSIPVPSTGTVLIRSYGGQAAGARLARYARGGRYGSGRLHRESPLRMGCRRERAEGRAAVGSQTTAT